MDEVVLAGVLGGHSAVVLDAEIHGVVIGSVHLAEEVREDLGGAHVGVAVGVSQAGAVQRPGELAAPVGIVLGHLGVGVVILENGVIALAPLGIVLLHVVGGETVGLAVGAAGVAGIQGAQLHAAARVAGLAGGGGGVGEDDGAVGAGADHGPDVAVVHAEDVAGLEVLSGEVLGEGAPAVVVGEALGLLVGIHDVTVVLIVGGALGVHHVVDDPADVAGAVGAAVIVLVEAAGVGIIAVGVVGIAGGGIDVLISVVAGLLLEEIDPGLGQADGHRLVGGIDILPIPGAAVHVERGAHGVHRGLEVVLEGALTGGAADGSGIVLGHERKERGVAVDLDGRTCGEIGSGLGGNSRLTGGVVGDLVDVGDVVGLAADRHRGSGGGFDLALGLGLGKVRVVQDAVLSGQIVDIALLKLVLDGILAVNIGEGEFLRLTVDGEEVGELIEFHIVAVGGFGAVALDAEVHGVLAGGGHRLAEEVGEDLVSAHAGIAVGVGQAGAVEVPGEVAGPGLLEGAAGSRGGVGAVGAQDRVIAGAPLGVVLGHVLGDELVGLAVLVAVAVGIQGAELNAAAALTGLAVGRRGVQEDDGAVIAHTDHGPDVAAHAEDVAGLERGDITGPGAPAVVCEGLGHLGGAHDVTIVGGVGGALGVHHVVGDPADVAGAVETGIVVLVPAVVRIVAVRGIGAVLVGVVGILLLEEVNPALGETDGHGLVGGEVILPVPARAEDVQRRTDGVHRGLEVVLEGLETGGAADGSGVILRHEREIQRVAVDLGGLANETVGAGNGGDGGGAGGVVADLIDAGVAAGRAADGHGAGADRGDLALCSSLGSGSGGHLAVLDRQVVNVAFLQGVLDGIAVVGGNGVLHFAAASEEAVNEIIFAGILGGHGAVVLHAQVHIRGGSAGSVRAVRFKSGSRRDKERGEHREDKQQGV